MKKARISDRLNRARYSIRKAREINVENIVNCDQRGARWRASETGKAETQLVHSIQRQLDEMDIALASILNLLG